MSKQFHRNLNSPLSGNLTYDIVWSLGHGIFEGSLFCSHRVYRVILAFLFAFFFVWSAFHVSDLLGAFVFSWFPNLAIVMSRWEHCFYGKVIVN